MVINIVLGGGVLALGDSVGGHALVGGVFSSAKLLCERQAELATRLWVQDENSVITENRLELTSHMPVDELQLPQPLCALGLKFGQGRFGLLPVGLVLFALGLQFLVLEGALLKGSLGHFELLIRLGFCQDGGFQIFL